KAIAGKRWKSGEKKYCIIMTLYIKNAFNSAGRGSIVEALGKFSVPGYMRGIVVDYFKKHILHYSTDEGPKKYGIIGGVP
ncbi:hypothetical protein KR009_006122, partial [Drosophila setifemur]